MNGTDLRRALVGTPVVIVLWLVFAPDGSMDDSIESILSRGVIVALLSMIVLAALSHLARNWRERRYEPP